MTKCEELAAIFERMARILAFKGEDRFRILAYSRAAGSLREIDDTILENMSREGRLDEIPSIGESLAALIGEYLRTGKIRKFDRERRSAPDELIDLLEIPGLGPKTLARLHYRLQVSNLEDLERAIRTQSILTLPGFGRKKLDNLQRGVELWLASRERMPFGVAEPLALETLAAVRKLPGIERADLAGSIRRGCETIGDIDLLIVSSDPKAALRSLSRQLPVRRVLALGDTRASVALDSGIQVDVRAVGQESYGAALQYFTGSKAHNVHLRTIARQQGLKINEYGVFRGVERIAGSAEEEIYAALHLPIMPPELREDRGEIEAAARNQLPNLIEFSDLQGDLHVHSNYSDGRNTMEQMVQVAASRGYRYIAFTDHSPAQRIARGLDEDRLLEKLHEIEKLRQNRGIRILSGAEVDILPDGSLDYPDDLLASLDVVVAAIHGTFQQSPDAITGRLLDALDHPCVHVLAHPTARLFGSRPPLQFDFERIAAKAAEKKVALEINGSRLRLDLNDKMARIAQSAGALLAIGSDAHSIAQLGCIRHGVVQARRGWIEAAHVVNTWPLDRLTGWLQSRKRLFETGMVISPQSGVLTIPVD